MAEATCLNYGCVPDYVGENLCQCNDACELYNDCCVDYKSECTNATNYAEANTIYSSIVMAILVILLVLIIIQSVLLKRNQETKQKSVTTRSDDRVVIVCTFLSITFYCICCLCYLISSIALNGGDFDTKINAETAATLFWSFGYGVMQIVLVGRLYFTFNNTSYAYPKGVYILLAIIYLIATAAMIMFHVEFNRRDEFNKVLWDNPTLLTATSIGFVCHIIFLLLVMILYVRALFKIAVDRSKNLLSEKAKLVDNDTIKLLMDHTTRMSVLTIIGGITTIVAFTIWCIYFAEEDKTQGGQGVTTLFLNVAWWLLPFDGMINAICLFLNLPFIFTYKVYSLLCCACHGVCGSICTSITSSMVKEKEVPQTPGSEQREMVNVDDNVVNQPET